MILFDGFLMRALVAGLGVALAAGPLGCFVVWRRMAYFGDATAHATILGVALALAFGTSIFAGTVTVAVAMALAMTQLGSNGRASDTILGVLSHGALALGLLAVSLIPGMRIDITAYLFGDILAVRPTDIAVIWGGGALVLLLLAWRWSSLLTATLGSDLAHASDIDPRREQLVLTLALAVTIAVAIKVVGALLISALLLIPAASARSFASTPERMAIVASVLGCISAVGGVLLSYVADTPTGPSIVGVATAIFVLSLAARTVR